MSWLEVVTKFLKKVMEIYVSNPKRKEPADGSNGFCDCIGLIIGAIRRMGLKWIGIHGCNWAARKEFVKLNPISSVNDLELGDVVLKGRPPTKKGWDLPARYQKGGKYYNGDLTDYYHAGVVESVNPLRIRHMASKMTTDTALDHNKNSVWNYHGKLKILINAAKDYAPETKIEPGTPTEGCWAVVVAPKGGSVNMRSKPGFSFGIMARVPLKTRVEIITPGEEWAYICYGLKYGYMKAEFLDIIGDGKGEY